MQTENESINAKNGKSSPTEGSEQGQIDAKAIMDKLNAISGTVIDLTTRQSDMERMLTETRELNDILSSVKGQSEPTGYDNSSQSEQNQQGQQVQGQQVQGVPNADQPVTQKQLQQYLQNINAGMSEQVNRLVEAVDKMKVKDYERDPDFNKKIRPEAYKLSKQFPNKSLDELVNIAKGNVALKDVNTLKDQLSEAQKKLEEFESKASAGEKPGFWLGQEPPKEMTADEAHEDALEKAGLSGLPE